MGGVSELARLLRARISRPPDTISSLSRVDARLPEMAWLKRSTQTHAEEGGASKRPSSVPRLQVARRHKASTQGLQGGRGAE